MTRATACLGLVLWAAAATVGERQQPAPPQPATPAAQTPAPPPREQPPEAQEPASDEGRVVVTIAVEGVRVPGVTVDLYSLEMRAVWKLALMLPSFRAGGHGAWSEVRTARGVEFEIRTVRPRPVNADGELIAETPAVFRCHPRALEVFASPGGAAG